MSGSRLGVWMPKQKDGKNWKVDWVVEDNQGIKEGTRTFRVKANAQNWINKTRNIENTIIGRDEGFKVVKATISKLEK